MKNEQNIIDTDGNDEKKGTIKASQNNNNKIKFSNCSWINWKFKWFK